MVGRQQGSVRPGSGRTRAWIQRVGALAALGLVCSACSFAPSGTSSLAGASTNANGLGGSGSLASPSTAGTTGTGSSTSPTGSGALSGSGGGGTGALGSSSSSQAAAQSAAAATQAASGVRSVTVHGKTMKVVTIAMSMKTQSCGSSSSDSAAEDEATYNNRFQAYVNFFNKYVLAPDGYELRYDIVNDGGTDESCADEARAGALQATQQDHAFAVLDSSGDCIAGDPLVFPDVVTANHAIYIGPCYETTQELANAYPYAWSDGAVTSRELQNLVWYIAKRIKNTDYVNPDTHVSAPRVYGELFFDDPIDQQLAQTMASELASYGISVKQYFISGNASTAASQAASLVLQMEQAGVNSLINTVDDDSGVEFMDEMSSENYYPTILVSDYGGWPDAFFMSLYPETEMRDVQGVATPAVEELTLGVTPTGTCEEGCTTNANNGGGYITAYQQGGGTQDASDPQNGAPAYSMFTDLAMLSIGITHAGSTLNAYTWAKGLEQLQSNSCEQQRYWGLPSIQAYATYIGPGIYWLGHGYTTIFWDPTAKSDFGTEGYYQSYDDYYRYDSYAALPSAPTWNTEVKGFRSVAPPKSPYTIDTPC